MPLTSDELLKFYQFALGVLKNDNQADSLQDLVSKWDAQRKRASVNEAIHKGHAEILAGGRPCDEQSKERAAANESILQSLSEFEAGQGEPVREFLDNMKTKYNLTLDSNT